ncbi:MAG: amidase [Actinomycetes bacterium]
MSTRASGTSSTSGSGRSARGTKAAKDPGPVVVRSDPVPETAVGIAAAVRAGTLTPQESVAASLRRIVAHDGRLGAFQVVRARAAADEAVEAAGRKDLKGLPLAGVPIAVKDNIAVAGEPMRSGSAATDAAPRTYDHVVVERLRAAGAVVVGLTRVPELCVFGATDSSYGITHNPWDRSRTPGGSSGGSAAAVAGGLVPVAHGNDGMGSIRIPAACCGVYGIKPGYGVVPSGVGANGWYDMSENGPLATTVADAALVLSVMAAQPGLAEVVEPDRPLRIAVSLRPPVTGVRADLEHLRAVVRIARLLERAGHIISKVDPPYAVNPAPELARWFGGASFDAEGLDRTLLDPAVRAHVRIGDQVRRRGVVRESDRESRRTDMAEFFSFHDLLLTPVLAAPPIAAARWGTRPWARVVAANVRFAPYAAPWNMLQYPAASVPAGIHPAVGTPLAVQVVGPDGTESGILGLSAQIERLAPWRRRAPGH